MNTSHYLKSILREIDIELLNLSVNYNYNEIEREKILKDFKNDVLKIFKDYEKKGRCKK